MYICYLQWLFLLLFGVHPPVSSCLNAVLLIFIPFHVLISLLLSIFFVNIPSLFGVHPPVSSCLNAVLLIYIPFHVLISLLLSIFFVNIPSLFGVHPPVSSCIIAALLMFYSVSCVNFFTFIHIFSEFCK